jgi:hypothetical protein
MVSCATLLWETSYPEETLERSMSMRRLLNRVVLTIASGTLFASGSAHGDVSNLFDRDTGANVYSDLADSTWVTSFAGLNPNAGTEFLGTANGNATGFFSSSLLKTLGGVIEDQTYAVSFFISKYEDSPTPASGVSFSDFERLRIGGAGGSMVWLSTPTPVVNNLWIEWRGVYEPGAADIGQQFRFDAAWQLHARTSLAIDGPMTAIVPEPTTTPFIFGFILLVLSLSRHRPDTVAALSRTRNSRFTPAIVPRKERLKPIEAEPSCPPLKIAGAAYGDLVEPVAGPLNSAAQQQH